jgi:hypothetical protein
MVAEEISEGPIPAARHRADAAAFRPGSEQLIHLPLYAPEVI